MSVDASATAIPAAPVTATARPDRTRRALQSAVLLAPSALILVLGWQRRWMDEDSFINLRILDQLFAGHGPVFNAGERVESYTSPLWLGVLALARGTLGQVMAMEWATVVTCLALSVGGFALGCVRRAAAALGRRAGRPGRTARGRGDPGGVGLLDQWPRDRDDVALARRRLGSAVRTPPVRRSPSCAGGG